MTIQPELLSAYHWHRHNAVGAVYPREPGPNPANEAIHAARKDVANGKARYASSPWVKFVGNGVRFDGQKQWIEQPSTMGLRYVGFAHDIVMLDHTSWFLDDSQHETACGAVYQLTGKSGRARFVAGYGDPYNGSAASDGPAVIDWSEIFESESDDYSLDGYGFPRAAHDAARSADHITESMVEEARECDSAWRAGSLYSDLGEEIKAIRSDLLAAIGQFKEVRRELSRGVVPNGTAVQSVAPELRFARLCELIRSDVQTCWNRSKEARDKREKLKAGDVEPYNFYAGEELKAAFNEGAGAAVL